MRRFLLRRLLPGIALAVLLAAGWGGWRMYRSLKGPRPPICQEPALQRSSFETPRQISSAEAPGARRYDIEPGAALLPDGAVALVYNTRDPIYKGTSGLVTGRIDLDGRVTLRPYATDRQEAFDAWMTDGPDGKVRMVWLGHDGGTPEHHMKVGYTESADGLAWTAPGVGHAPADCPGEDNRGCVDKPMIAAGPGGVYVVYFSHPGGGLRVARGGLTGTRFETSSLAEGTAYADMVLTPSGVLHLVATSFTQSGFDRYGDPKGRVIYTRSADGGRSFEAAVVASKPGVPVPFFFSNPQVAVDEARGFVYVAFPAGTPDGRWDIYLGTSRDGGKTWSHLRVNDDAHCASHMTPEAALDPRTGTLHLTWLENRTGQGGLAYAACEPGGARCGANEAVSDKPFASYSFERHLPAWLSEYGVLLVDAERRWLHALWTQPVDEGGSAVSRIFYARKKLP